MAACGASAVLRFTDVSANIDRIFLLCWHSIPFFEDPWAGHLGAASEAQRS
jgi:hypothetical protein